MNCKGKEKILYMKETALEIIYCHLDFHLELLECGI